MISDFYTLLFATRICYPIKDNGDCHQGNLSSLTKTLIIIFHHWIFHSYYLWFESGFFWFSDATKPQNFSCYLIVWKISPMFLVYNVQKLLLFSKETLNALISAEIFCNEQLLILEKKFNSWKEMSFLSCTYIFYFQHKKFGWSSKKIPSINT